MTDGRYQVPRRTWAGKFVDAFHGAWLGVRGQGSFGVHAVAALGVVLAAWAFDLGAWQWVALLICITIVMTAEMFNSALEHLARAVDPSFNPHLRAALDIASAAVLLAAIGAISVATVIFLPKLFAVG